MSGMGERILVVDDEEPMREIMAVILQAEGYECQSVPSGVSPAPLLLYPHSGKASVVGNRLAFYLAHPLLSGQSLPPHFHKRAPERHRW